MGGSFPLDTHSRNFSENHQYFNPIFAELYKRFEIVMFVQLPKNTCINAAYYNIQLAVVSAEEAKD